MFNNIFFQEIKMKVLIGVGIVLLFLVYSSNREIRQIEDFRIKHDCIEYEKIPSKVRYVRGIDSSYEITSAKTVYLCSNGETITRED